MLWIEDHYNKKKMQNKEKRIENTVKFIIIWDKLDI